MARRPHGCNRLVAPVAVMAAVALASCSARTVTAFRLQHDAEQVQSLAADGALLALGARRGDVTDAFVRVHAAELAAEAEDLRTVLASADPGPARASATAAVVRLSGRVAAQLDALRRRPGDRPLAASVHTTLDGIARTAERIAGRTS
ncbi:MAG: hypothetical protein QOD86_1652 [Miltoncostaeaceae bacterium]|jgi:uncharacterized protein YciI|nr:hypothetical protein [Miltoncostaeaceae bacterium]